MRKLTFLSMWIFVFCIPWENAIVLGALGAISRIIGLGAGFLCVIAIVIAGHVRINDFAVATLLFVSYASLSVLWSPYPDDAYEAAETAFQLAAMVVLLHQLADNPSHIRTFFLAYILGCVVTALLTIHTFQTSPDMYTRYQRFAASGFNENAIALRIALAIPMAWHIALTARTWPYRCILIFVPVGVYAAMLTGSRTGFVCTMIALGTPLLHIRGASSGGKAAVMLGVVPLMSIGLLGIVNLVPDSTLQRIGTVAEGETYQGPGGLNGRAAIWAAGLEMSAGSPLVGTGVGTFFYAMADAVDGPGRGAAAHNGLVALAGDLGLVGLTVYFLLLACLAKAVLAMPAEDRRTWYVLMAVLIPAFLMGNWVWNKETWLLFALATAYARSPHQPQLSMKRTVAFQRKG